MERHHQLTLLSNEDATSWASPTSPRYGYQDLIFACLLAVIFALLVPVMEWPDAMDHIARKLAQQTMYPPDVFSSFAGLQAPALNGEHRVFADHYKYRPLPSYFLVNLERLPLVLMLIVTFYLLAKKVDRVFLLFCPPLIYSLASPSQEVVAISVLLVAGLVSHRYPKGAVLLAALSMAIDRSMVPCAVFLVLFVAASPFRSFVANLRLVLLAGLLLLVATNLVSPLDLIGTADNNARLIFGLTVADIRYGAEHGEHKLLALAASTMGLYGWLSIRPFPFLIYYPVIMLLFTVGFMTSQSSRQSIFIALFLLVYLVLWLIPSLAQARYYPLLTLAFWSMVISGAQAIKINRVGFYGFVTLTTATGCAVSLLNAM